MRPRSLPLADPSQTTLGAGARSGSFGRFAGPGTRVAETAAVPGVRYCEGATIPVNIVYVKNA